MRQILKAFTYVNRSLAGRLFHSSHLGVTCPSFFRCIAACLSIADPDLVDGAAIFFGLGMRPLRENPLRAAGSVMQAQEPLG